MWIWLDKWSPIGSLFNEPPHMDITCMLKYSEVDMGDYWWIGTQISVKSPWTSSSWIECTILFFAILYLNLQWSMFKSND